MRKQLKELRIQMEQNNIDLYIVPDTDYHGSEYVNEYFKCREYISGFTGSAGTLVVTSEWAGLWTDGRYFIQAEAQLAGSGIQLMKSGIDEVPSVDDFVIHYCKEHGRSRLGFDGKIMSYAQGSTLEKYADIVWNMDLIGKIWRSRPKIIPSEIYELNISVTGESFKSKIRRVRAEMSDCDFLLITKLEQIAWLYNLRGSDIKHTPVFFAFALIGKTADTLYVMDSRFNGNNVRPYMQIFDDLKSLKNCRIMLETSSTSYALIKTIDKSVDIIDRENPIDFMKAVKNKTEISCTRNAHIRDGIAMVKFIYWIKNAVGNSEISEISAADYLENCRREQGAYDLSFDTIAGYEENGAIIHYKADKTSNKTLAEKGFLLVDSGGQYEDGTTDITRTIALGDISADRKIKYTAVLKANIQLAMAEFKKGTTGDKLDITARKPLIDMGLDFNHGTGHGVGHMLSVHEGPNTISKKKNSCEIVPGMITSDEPGVYFEGEYGIRLENEILCIEQNNMLCFETITLCPFDRDAIDVKMLDAQELEFLNAYHQRVYDILIDYLDKDTGIWLKKETEKL